MPTLTKPSAVEPPWQIHSYRRSSSLDEASSRSAGEIMSSSSFPYDGRGLDSSVGLFGRPGRSISKFTNGRETYDASREAPFSQDCFTDMGIGEVTYSSRTQYPYHSHRKDLHSMSHDFGDDRYTEVISSINPFESMHTGAGAHHTTITSPSHERLERTWRREQLYEESSHDRDSRLASTHGTYGASRFDAFHVIANELEVPSVVGSETSRSSLDFSPEESPWHDDRKIPATLPACTNRLRDYSRKSEIAKSQCMYGKGNGIENNDRNYDFSERYDNYGLPLKQPATVPGFQQMGAIMSGLYARDKHGNNKKAPSGGCTQIEVSPGEFLRLRGADETWKAVLNDFYMPCLCICCEQTLFCIQDAVFVLCPICRVVSPLERVVYGDRCCCDGGVGLGFTMDDLAKWQNDIERNRR
jgi:hypothetical protein